VLLIDDIQFLAGKEGTQEEFFHTFNALHQNNKQVVLTSDRPPKSIPALENRLLSRFEWGMIADISLPDFETRLAILEAKALEKQYQINKEIVHYLAVNIASNIRELEGALNRIIAYHQLNAIVPTLESVKKILSGLTTNLQKKSLTPKDILHTVAHFYDVAIDDILGASREKKLVTPRQIIMFLMREEIKSSFPTIGEELGGRDHTTAMHAVLKIKTDYDNDEKIRREIEQLRQRLYNI
jgi:chromosomal replication initiator protein